MAALGSRVGQGLPAPLSAAEIRAIRMSDAKWRAFTGICGHQHVPDNDHWDPGRLDVSRMLALAPADTGTTFKNFGRSKDEVLYADLAVVVIYREKARPSDSDPDKTWYAKFAVGKTAKISDWGETTDNRFAGRMPDGRVFIGIDRGRGLRQIREIGPP